jgi:SAM-dependent methyltransferase
VLELARKLAATRPLVVHDLGCGTGSMGRWLAPRLPGGQHWILHDTDADLLARARADPPATGADGAVITLEVRQDDITRLGPADLAGASLVTASALLDMFTSEELDRFVRSCELARCPVLLTLSVVGLVELTPTDPLDRVIVTAFNDHQQRLTGRGRLLGPAAVTAAADAFAGLGWAVQLRVSPWRLDGGQPDLLAQWLAEWAGAAAVQQPEFDRSITEYLRRRTEQLTTGRLAVTVHHRDLLAIPP